MLLEAGLREIVYHDITAYRTLTKREGGTLQKQSYYFNSYALKLLLIFIFFTFSCNSETQDVVRTAQDQTVSTGYQVDEPNTPSVDHKLIAHFEAILAEYDRQGELEKNVSSPDEVERAHLRRILVFREMNCFYNNFLGEKEFEVIYSSREKQKQLPKGIQIDMGDPIDNIAGISLSSGRTREDFETFLKISFMETDYTGSFQISYEDRDDLEVDYFEYLLENKLTCFED
jgi:hypothetical protein